MEEDMKIEQQIIHAQDKLIWLLSRKRYSIETYNKVCKQIADLKAQLKEQEEKDEDDKFVDLYLNDQP